MAKLVVVQLPSITGLDEDVHINNFAFVGGEGATLAEHIALAQAVADLYNVLPAGNTRDVAFYLSDEISRTALACTASVYDLTGALDGGPHGSPVAELPFTLDATIEPNSLPAEVAMAVRLEAAGRADALVETADGVDEGTAVDRPKQRLTGRVYFGPLVNHIELITDGTSPARPTAQFGTDLRQAMADLANTVIPAAIGSDMQLGVWSRANQSITTLEAVSTDNAFDSQRRRGPSPTALVRTTTP